MLRHLLVVALFATHTTAPDVDVRVAWQEPVDTPIVQPFDAPDSRFGAGHLGVDYRPPADTPVRAAGPGAIVYVGNAGGATHVTIKHVGELRTTYSFLETTAVTKFQVVRAGQVIGTTGGSTFAAHAPGTFHFGVRAGDTYVDPMSLFGEVDLAEVVHLAPTLGPFGYSIRDERGGILDGFRNAIGGVLGQAGDFLDAAGDLVPPFTPMWFMLKSADYLLPRTLDILLGLPPTSLLGLTITGILTIADVIEERKHCDPNAPPADGTGGSGNRAMVVAGLDSHASADALPLNLPTSRLGYEPQDVGYFSYGTTHNAYDSADTHAPILDSAHRLADQLRDFKRKQPGRAVDLIGHSLGGLVIAAFLKLVYDPNDPTYPRIGKVVLFASPFEGAPLATLVTSHQLSDAPSVKDMSEQSAFIAELEATEFPPDVEVTSIGSVFDWVVPADLATTAGVQHLVVETDMAHAHSAVLTDADALRGARAGLEGRNLPCRTASAVLLGAVVPPAITAVEQVAAASPFADEQ